VVTGAPGSPCKFHLEAPTKRLFQRSKADWVAAHRQEHFMHVCPFFISDAQAAGVIQPSNGSFDDPAQRTQPGAVRRTPACRTALDPASAQRLSVWLRVIGAIRQHSLRTGPGRTALAANRRGRISQRQQLLHIVRIGAGGTLCQRQRLSIDGHMVLETGLAAIRRILSSFFPEDCT
jgi:hypothetical protein